MMAPQCLVNKESIIVFVLVILIALEESIFLEDSRNEEIRWSLTFWWLSTYALFATKLTKSYSGQYMNHNQWITENS